LGTFCPAARASERPIAIACFRLFTFRPERPLLNVPALRFLIARPTLADAFFEYFRAMIALLLVSVTEVRIDGRRLVCEPRDRQAPANQNSPLAPLRKSTS